MNKKNLLIIVFLSFLPVLFLSDCSKKGKLLEFNSEYQLYPGHWQKYGVFIKEGTPEYVVYGSDKYEERWIYICQNKVYNFQALPNEEKKDDEEQRFKITAEPLRGSELEKKLSAKDRERLKKCIEKEEKQS